MTPATVYGNRIRKPRAKRWTRGAAFRRVGKRWLQTGTTWATEDAAEKRLAEYRLKGYAGHVFAIEPAVTYPTATHYSKHFTRAELECKGRECDGKRPPVAVERKLTKLAAQLEVLRSALGKGSLGILSGYRCPVHNRTVNGAVNSQHMAATAADIAVPWGEQPDYVRAAETVAGFRNGGIGIYPGGGVHVDLRGWKARWSSWVGSR